MKGAFRALVLALIALALAGCAGWFGRPKRQELAPLPAVSGAVSVRTAWTARIGRAGVGIAPALAGDGLWAAAYDGTVVRLDPASGRTLWSVDVGRPITAGVGSDGDTAVVVTRDGQVVALDGAGRVRWRVPLGTDVTTVPAVALGTVLVRGADNRVVALDVDTGERRWLLQRPNPALVLRQTGGIAIGPDTAYVGMPGGRLLAVALATGAPRWEIALALPRGTSEIERIADVVGSPLVSGREVCAVAYQGRIGCFDTASGNQVWARDFSSSSGLEVDARFVFAADADDHVHAFSRTGGSAWRQNALAGRSLTAPASVGNSVALGDRTGLVHLLSRDDGAPLARASVDGSAVLAAPLVADPLVYVQTAAGALVALRVE